MAIFIAYDGLRSGDKIPIFNMVAPTKESFGLGSLKGAGRIVQDVGTVFSKGLSTILEVSSGPAPRDDNSTD